jgi:ACS family hexuronate transporter-like MFS transporter
VATRVGRYRWTICALLFFATTINYMDRQVLGLLAPTLQREVGWSESDYGAIVSWFTLAYAFGFLVMGRADGPLRHAEGVRRRHRRVEPRGDEPRAGQHGGGVQRRALRARPRRVGQLPGRHQDGERVVPGARARVRHRIFNAGSNVGAIITPILVPWVAINWGWRVAFIVVGALGFVWLAFWLAMYRRPEEHPRLSTAELAHIRSDAVEATTPVPWRSLLGYRQTWAFAIGKMLTDPVWWFYLYWLPKFLDAKYGIELSGVALPLITIYLLADVGSVGGGWLSGSSSRAAGR